MDKIKFITKFLISRYSKFAAAHRTKNIPAFQVLVWAFLSHRTRDENTEKAFFRLIKVAKTPKEILALPRKKLEALIKPCGFYRVKAKRLKEICKDILEKFHGRVPKMREQLMSLTGVGYKTSAIVLSESFSKPMIPIDTHWQRIPKRLGIVPEKIKDVEKIRAIVERTFPRKAWPIISVGMIQFGREICKPVGPKCLDCLLLKVCPYGKKRMKALKNNKYLNML